jgi:hypothetical protein
VSPVYFKCKAEVSVHKKPDSDKIRSSKNIKKEKPGQIIGMREKSRTWGGLE